MRIAIFGKGGSGKTTVSSLLGLYLSESGYRVGLMDVDVNSHTANILGKDSAPVLSEAENVKQIEKFLAGSNPLVKPGEFLNSTPPGRGSNFWRLHDDNFVTKNFGAKINDNLTVFTVGSYKTTDIGLSCHHGNQQVAENLLSHLKLTKKDLIVVDNVAGNDAFGNSLFDQDILVFIVKPEREGVLVYQRMKELAEKAGIADRLFVIGNQIMTKKQEQFLRDSIDEGKLLGVLNFNEDIINDRLDNKPITEKHLTKQAEEIFAKILETGQKIKLSPAQHYQHMIELHKKVAAEGWVAGAYRSGLEDQIDEGFSVDE